MKLRTAIYGLPMLVPFVAWLIVGAASASERDVQIVDVDFETNVIELHNFDSVDHALNGWQFCTQDADETLQYSPSNGFALDTIDAGKSLFIYFDGDAPAEPGHINRPGVGSQWAEPLSRGSYALSLYFPPVSFVNGNTMADHVQWSINGVDNNIADERSDEAENGGVWTDQSAWVATAADSPFISLLPQSEGLVLHGPDDYTTLPEPSSALAHAGALLCVAAAAKRRRKAQP
jgi:hypothetical protein